MIVCQQIGLNKEFLFSVNPVFSKNMQAYLVITRSYQNYPEENNNKIGRVEEKANKRLINE